MEMHPNIQQVEQIAEVVQGQPHEQVLFLQIREAGPGGRRTQDEAPGMASDVHPPNHIGKASAWSAKHSSLLRAYSPTELQGSFTAVCATRAAWKLWLLPSSATCLWGGGCGSTDRSHLEAPAVA